MDSRYGYQQPTTTATTQVYGTQQYCTTPQNYQPQQGYQMQQQGYTNEQPFQAQQNYPQQNYQQFQQTYQPQLQQTQSPYQIQPQPQPQQTYPMQQAQQQNFQPQQPYLSQQSYQIQQSYQQQQQQQQQQLNNFSAQSLLNNTQAQMALQQQQQQQYHPQVQPQSYTQRQALNTGLAQPFTKAQPQSGGLLGTPYQQAGIMQGYSQQPLIQPSRGYKNTYTALGASILPGSYAASTAAAVPAAMTSTRSQFSGSTPFSLIQAQGKERDKDIRRRDFSKTAEKTPEEKEQERLEREKQREKERAEREKRREREKERERERVREKASCDHLPIKAYNVFDRPLKRRDLLSEFPSLDLSHSLIQVASPVSCSAEAPLPFDENVHFAISAEGFNNAECLPVTLEKLAEKEYFGAVCYKVKVVLFSVSPPTGKSNRTVTVVYPEEATEKFGQRQLEFSGIGDDHLEQRAKLLVGDNGRYMAYGGYWITADGDPSTDEGLINTAIRTVRAQLGLDLSKAKHWRRLLAVEIDKSAYESASGVEQMISAPVPNPKKELEVFLSADIAECLPSLTDTLATWEKFTAAHAKDNAMDVEQKEKTAAEQDAEGKGASEKGSSKEDAVPSGSAATDASTVATATATDAENGLPKAESSTVSGTQKHDTAGTTKQPTCESDTQQRLDGSSEKDSAPTEPTLFLPYLRTGKYIKPKLVSLFTLIDTHPDDLRGEMPELFIVATIVHNLLSSRNAAAVLESLKHMQKIPALRSLKRRRADEEKELKRLEREGAAESAKQGEADPVAVMSRPEQAADVARTLTVIPRYKSEYDAQAAKAFLFFDRLGSGSMRSQDLEKLLLALDDGYASAAQVRHLVSFATDGESRFSWPMAARHVLPYTQPEVDEIVQKEAEASAEATEAKGE